MESMIGVREGPPTESGTPTPPPEKSTRSRLKTSNGYSWLPGSRPGSPASGGGGRGPVIGGAASCLWQERDPWKGVACETPLVAAAESG